MDITVIVALLAAISAIIAPAITSIINNRHALKVIKIEKFIASRINIIEKYVSTAGQLISHPSHESRLEFGNYCSQIYLYVPYTYWEDLFRFKYLSQFPISLRRGAPLCSM